MLHAVRRELAQTVEDVLVRRIHLYFETRDRGCARRGGWRNCWGGELGWSSGQESWRPEVAPSSSRRSGAGSGLAARHREDGGLDLPKLRRFDRDRLSGTGGGTELAQVAPRE